MDSDLLDTKAAHTDSDTMQEFRIPADLAAQAIIIINERKTSISLLNITYR